MELVGTEIRKNFTGFGVFTGVVQSYDAASGYFQIQYEDGDSEEVDFGEIESILREMSGSSPILEHTARKRKRGRPPKKRTQLDADPVTTPGTVINFENGEALVTGKEGFWKLNEHHWDSEGIQESGGCNGDDEQSKRPRMSGIEKSSSRKSARRASNAAKCENSLVSQDDDLGGGREGSELVPNDPILIKPELPPSSNDLDLDGLNPFDLLSVYTCLRSFSRLLFLSPFRLEAFVAALRCNYADSLIDSIHFSILQALKPHLELLAEDGCRSAADCLRYLNWEFLDLVTWPLFLVHYLAIHGSRTKPGFRPGQLKLLDSEYYTQPAGVKLEVLRCLCDDVIEVDSIRSELSRRMDSEVKVATCINMDIEKKRRSSTSVEPPADKVIEETDDGNIDECCLCGMDGSLICCDGCPAAFHSRCVGVAKDLLPEGEWYCPECIVEKSNGLAKLSKPSRGAELLGIDPHGRLYFGSCGRLLVSDSCESYNSYHYYNKDDLASVVTMLKSSFAYSSIANAVSMYWGSNVDVSSLYNQSGTAIYDSTKECLPAQVHSEPPLPAKQDVVGNGNTERPTVEISASSEQCGLKSFQVSDLIHLDSATSHELVGINYPSSCSEPFNGNVHSPCIQQPYQNGIDCSLGPPSSPGIAIKNTDSTADSNKCTGFSGWVCVADRNKHGPSELQSDSGNYINYYSFGRISSLIFAELMHKSSEGNSKEIYKSIEDIKSAQIKAISKISSKISSSAYQRLPKDLQKENCGWCLSCKTSSDVDCLLKVSAKGSKHKNINGSQDKSLEDSKDDGLLDSKSSRVESSSEGDKKWHITSAIHHILSIEGRAGSLMSGPWEKPHYSQYWRKIVMKALDVATLKPLLLSLELNLRRVALSLEWLKPVDDAHAIVSSSVVTSPVRGSSSYIGSRRQGKKNIGGGEVSCMSRRVAVSDIYWWRGGRLTRQLFRSKILPRALASKGGRQGGGRKIPHLLYPDGLDFAKRSKYVSWRVAVEMSQSVAELTYLAKDLDSNIKWADVSNCRFFSKLAKESKKMAKRIKKVTICGKCKEGKQVKYLLDFGTGESVPGVVMKHGILLEKSTAGRKRYWLTEAHVPLNLLKSYEEKKMKKRKARLLKKTDSRVHHAKEMNCKIKKRKRSEWLSYLITKEEKADKQLCGHCNKDVLAREAVNCQFCSGLFHRKHFRVPKGSVTAIYACNKCRDTIAINMKDKDTKDLKLKSNVSKIVKANDKDPENLKAKETKNKNSKIVKAKEQEIKSINATEGAMSNEDVKIKGKKNVREKKKGKKSRTVKDKNKKNMQVEEQLRRSDRVKQRHTKITKVKSQGLKIVFKMRQISESKELDAIPNKGKRLLMKRKKYNNRQRSKRGRPRKIKSEKSENGINWYKMKRSVVHHPYWLNGLLWSHESVTERQRDFRESNIILPSQLTDPSMKPSCCLCLQEYNSRAIYICCEHCQDWFHGDVFCLTAETIKYLIGFRCHKCRMRSEPLCPFAKNAFISYADLDTASKTGMCVVGNNHQNLEDNVNVVGNDKDKPFGGPVVCEEDQFDGGVEVDACIERQKDEAKDHGSSHEDCSTKIRKEDYLDESQIKNITEKGSGFPFQAILTNGRIVGIQQIDSLERSRGAAHENDSSIVESQDGMDVQQREGQPTLCLLTSSTNMHNVKSVQQVEVHVGYSESENKIEAGLALHGTREGLCRIGEVPDSVSEVVSAHGDIMMTDPSNSTSTICR